jgi:predicted  nucleic acid-binding Zn-ribbon protein
LLIEGFSSLAQPVRPSEAVDLQQKLMALANLQKIDLEIAAVRKAAEGYPRQLAEMEKELTSARGALETERNRLLELDRNRRTLEQKMTDEKDKVRKWEARLAEQRTTREYAALAREIDIAKKTNQTMVEELAELGKSQAAAREAVRGKEQELAARQDTLAGAMAQLRKSIAEVQGQIRTLEEQRAKSTSSVDKIFLHRYDAVRKRRMPALVAVLAPGVCQGCNMNVPPQLYNVLRSTLGTDVCPSCHRIIYASEALESANS